MSVNHELVQSKLYIHLKRVQYNIYIYMYIHILLLLIIIVIIIIVIIIIIIYICMYIHHESNRRSSYVYQQKPVVWGPSPAGSIKLFGYPWLLFWELFGDIIGIILCIYI
jgi:hypothetical protein